MEANSKYTWVALSTSTMSHKHGPSPSLSSPQTDTAPLNNSTVFLLHPTQLETFLSLHMKCSFQTGLPGMASAAKCSSPLAFLPCPRKASTVSSKWAVDVPPLLALEPGSPQPCRGSEGEGAEEAMGSVVSNVLELLIYLERRSAIVQTSRSRDSEGLRLSTTLGTLLTSLMLWQQPRQGPGVSMVTSVQASTLRSLSTLCIFVALVFSTMGEFFRLYQDMSCSGQNFTQELDPFTVHVASGKHVHCASQCYQGQPCGNTSNVLVSNVLELLIYLERRSAIVQTSRSRDSEGLRLSTTLGTLLTSLMLWQQPRQVSQVILV
ncbi:Hypothetical predicted protein [Marmota monax]|uniref:Uncharacterized protein n=1 Tax=Marmota monax TaxID=9995 RepID=A0A5E4CKH7_MARMO|nr:hypothetical protein GHT09_013163 [Marmota monax]VTJ82346.1 Hypothetical predicted protein [Marmota monax]